MDVLPAAVRTVICNGIEVLAADACFACEGTRVVKRGRLGVYPITTNVGVFDRPVLVVEPCAACNATGVRPVADSQSGADRATDREAGS
jgi:hypothetical protein